MNLDDFDGDNDDAVQIIVKRFMQVSTERVKKTVSRVMRTFLTQQQFSQELEA